MLPAQFKKENSENIFLYHYVEKMITDYSKFVKDIFPEFDENKKYVNNPIENKFSDKEFRKDKLKNYFDNIDNIDNIKCNEQYIKILNIYNCIKKLINEKH